MAFTYLIGWRLQDRWYYGYNSNDPSVLWNPYKTSSYEVESFIQEHGDPDVIRVHRLFDTKEEANDYEVKFLQRVGAVKSDRWLNKHDRKNFRGPSQFTESSRKKMSEAKKGRVPWNKGLKGVVKQTPESVAKRAAANRGKKRSPEQLENLRKGWETRKYDEYASDVANRAWITKKADPNFVGPNKGRIFDDEFRAKISKSKKGVPLSEEHKRKLSERMKEIRAEKKW